MFKRLMMVALLVIAPLSADVYKRQDRNNIQRVEQSIDSLVPLLGYRRACPYARFYRLAEPVAVLHVLEMGESPVVHHVVPDGVTFLPGKLVGEGHGDERLVVRPPELHVVPVFLNGLAVHVRIVAVSYTHLDVYKRQALDSSDESSERFLGDYIFRKGAVYGLQWNGRVKRLYPSP